MSIKLLPAELANQIAAGEVVERPASVVKELVENSIDSGASKIEIDIVQGGHKRILVRDNGNGIEKSQLELALSRHATSKIHSLDDLESIQSMGFRGEALASISSVSRLTLTSKPEAQSEAWQAQAFGREMQVEVRPAAHPKGTSVEVLDLFFNTPARRRFLRTEKTEFSHIDAIFKRIALANKSIEFVLTHNGKKVKHLKKTEHLDKRIRDLLGQFSQHQLIHIDSHCAEANVYGFVVQPDHGIENPEWQYSFVNHRPMRDKLINHAIKQALELMGLESQTPQYVLFVDVDPYQVDVNVHPAKHEVRFHQARAIHDFLVSALRQAIEQQINLTELGAQPIATQESAQHGYEVPAQLHDLPANQYTQVAGSRKTAVIGESAAAYSQLMSTGQPSDSQLSASLCVGDFFLVGSPDGLLILEKHQLQVEKLANELDRIRVSQPLLMPITLTLTKRWGEQTRQAFEQLHIHIDKLAGKLLLKQVPAGWRGMPWSQIAEQLIECEPEDTKAHLLGLIAGPLNRNDTHELNIWWQHLPMDQQGALISKYGSLLSHEQLGEFLKGGDKHGG